MNLTLNQADVLKLLLYNLFTCDKISINKHCDKILGVGKCLKQGRVNKINWSICLFFQLSTLGFLLLCFSNFLWLNDCWIRGWCHCKLMKFDLFCFFWVMEFPYFCFHSLYSVWIPCKQFFPFFSFNFREHCDLWFEVVLCVWICSYFSYCLVWLLVLPFFIWPQVTSVWYYCVVRTVA